MENSTNTLKPFLRWAGGKQWFLPELDKFLPTSFNNYHEPFLGGGAVFINLKAKGKLQGSCFLSDLNEDLINSYISVRDQLPTLISKLKKFKNEKTEYYNVRNQKLRSTSSRAAQFIYLNRTSFNGIYRVNLNGEYNVPFGNKKYAELFDFDNFKELSRAFQSCNFKSIDFYKTLSNISKGDLVFLDPPYTVAHELNGFVKYNQKIFQWEDQVRLREYIEVLKQKRAHIILTNAAHKSIEGLYKDVGTRFKLSRYSVIGGLKAKRQKYNELVFLV